VQAFERHATRLPWYQAKSAPHAASDGSAPAVQTSDNRAPAASSGAHAGSSSAAGNVCQASELAALQQIGAEYERARLPRVCRVQRYVLEGQGLPEYTEKARAAAGIQSPADVRERMLELNTWLGKWVHYIGSKGSETLPLTCPLFPLASPSTMPLCGNLAYLDWCTHGYVSAASLPNTNCVQCPVHACLVPSHARPSSSPACLPAHTLHERHRYPECADGDPSTKWWKPPADPKASQAADQELSQAADQKPTQLADRASAQEPAGPPAAGRDVAPGLSSAATAGVMGVETA
jgi:hypothetical protein